MPNPLFRRGGNCIQAINFRIGNGYDIAGCDLVLKFIIKVKPLSKSLILSSRPLFSGRAIIKAGGTVGGGGGNFPSNYKHEIWLLPDKEQQENGTKKGDRSMKTERECSIG